MKDRGDDVPLPHLRISIESKCNFRCTYCPPWGENRYEVEERVTADDVVDLALMLSSHGVRTAKITGGEPTLQKKVLAKLVSELSADFDDVILITNGWNLKDIVADLVSRGLTGVEVSIDAAERESFEQIVQHSGDFDAVQEGIRAASCLGLDLQLNSVVMHSNLAQVPLLLERASQLSPIRIKFLELVYYAFPGREFFEAEFIRMEEIEGLVQERSVSERWTVPHGEYGSPMRTYILPNDVEVILKDGTVGSVYSNVCDGCAQFPCQDGLYGLTLTVDGSLKMCKHRSDLAIDIGRSDQSRRQAVETAIDRYRSRYYTTGWMPTLAPQDDHAVDVKLTPAIRSWYRESTYGEGFGDRLESEGTAVMVSLSQRQIDGTGGATR